MALNQTELYNIMTIDVAQIQFRLLLKNKFPENFIKIWPIILAVWIFSIFICYKDKTFRRDLFDEIKFDEFFF